MNYLRGAVNVISAPYQYYRDLQPLNPSTLTGAIDVIVVQRPTDSGDTELVSSPFHVRFGKWQVLRPGEKLVNVSVNGNQIPFMMKIGQAGEAFFVFEADENTPDDLTTSPIIQPIHLEDSPPGNGAAITDKQDDLKEIEKDSPFEDSFEPELLELDPLPLSQEFSWEWGAFPQTPLQPTPISISHPIQQPLSDVEEPPPIPRKYAKAIRLTSDQLKALNLKPGANTVTFSLSASGAVACTARIFLWDSTDLVVVSDIDGTITKSDGLGHVFAMIGRDWTHLGVAKLYTDITRNGYKMMYLTSRAIGQADATRYYLKGIKQDNYQLPEGPVIMSPDRLMASLHREVIMRKPEVFKMACLQDIQRLFGETSRNPFYAGFGNRITDALSYRSVNVPSARIFTIDSTGEVKMELLELAGYKSSYIHMTDLVDQMFPPIHRKWTPEYTDFIYWNQPLQEYPLPEFSLPSPTLSAQSDASLGTLSRLRKFRLRSRSGSTRASSPSTDDIAEVEHKGEHRSRSTSPSESDSRTSDANDNSDDEESDNGGEFRRERRRSMTSMPGSLQEMQLDLSLEVEKEEYQTEEVYEDGHVVECDEVFDEDLLAAGEMNEVPFI